MRKPDHSPLFRPEAMAQQQDRWLGSVLLLPRISHSLWTGAAAVMVGGLILLIGLGEYTRKVPLTGSLAPEHGLLQIVAPQAGVLAQLAAQEGQDVAKGATLAVLSTERRSEAVGETQAEILRALRLRRDSLLAERQSHVALYDGQAASHRARLEVTQSELVSLGVEFDLLGDRSAMAQRSAARQRDLRQRGLATEDDLRRAEETASDQIIALQALERTRASLLRSKVELESEIAERPLRRQLQLAEMDRAIAQIEQELAEAEAARVTVIQAPQAGTITALRASAGNGIAAAQPLMTLIPAGTALEARLYGPSRDIGFVRPGQRVLIRYDAFPYQKFGYYEGTVRSVSRATVGTAELAETALGALAATGAADEPVYRITVALAAQNATAYGAPAALQPGMTLRADVHIERRRLWQWVLDPLYSLTGGRPA